MAQAAVAHSTNNPDINEAARASAQLRQTMVDRQLRTFDVTDVPLLQRFLDVPRENFLPADHASLAYSDLPITLADSAGKKSRALLPPLLLGRFLQAAALKPDQKALDIAGGAGYPAALLSGLAREVVALESDPALAEAAKANLAALGATNVRVETGSLAAGVPAAGPYDVIFIHGAVEQGLEQLIDQLTPTGFILAIAKLDADSGLQAVRIERANGHVEAGRPLFDATLPVLAEFATPPGFVF